MNKKKNVSDYLGTQNYITKIRTVLKNADRKTFQWSFKKNLRGYAGQIEESHITIDINQDFFPTLIHEMLHYIYPAWCESRVVKMEKRIKRYITERQVKNILKLFANLI